MSTREALAALIERFAPNEGPHDTCCGPRVGLYRVSQPSEPTYAVHEPAFCVLAQGRKRVLVGDAVHHYDDRNFFLASVDVPVVGQVIEASAGAMTPELFDAACRMIRLMETPEHAPVLAQLIEREILYRLLTGDQGPRLAQIARADGRLRQVNRAIGWIKRNFSQPFSIEDVAAEARMSASALHQHFKAVTALSPLQYQKQLRLQEARRLILVQRFDCATAGHKVGYDSPSQFSREYARLFGAPPLRDAARLREQPDLMVGA
jgi:AraC-like DNA-binding protein